MLIPVDSGHTRSPLFQSKGIIENLASVYISIDHLFFLDAIGAWTIAFIWKALLLRM